MLKIKRIVCFISFLLTYLSFSSCGFLSDSFDAITGATGLFTTEGNSPFHKSDGKNIETSEKWKVVSGTDLFSVRSLENPVKIEIRSFDKKTYIIDRNHEKLFSTSINVIPGNKAGFTIDRNHEKLFSTSINVIPGNKAGFTIEKDEEKDHASYLSIFYGMGMGHHSTNSFRGPPLDLLIEDKLDLFDEQWNSRGLVCFAEIDGYRAIYSFSELFNRTDHVRPILAISDDHSDDGYYRIFHPSSFYADRSVKSLSEIYFFKE